MQPSESAALNAKRALLRQQTELLGEQLPWLFDPDRISPDVLRAAGGQSHLTFLCFHLAVWMLEAIVQAASRVRDELSWEDTFARYKVLPEHVPRVVHAVLEPTSRHAPGLVAMSEIVAAAALVAAREGVPRAEWAGLATVCERFAVQMSCDGTDVQTLVRTYLRKPQPSGAAPAELDPALLRLDDDLGVSTVTPLADLLAAARAAAAAHVAPPRGVCVAMQARAPSRQPAAVATTMYGAIWSAYAAAAGRLIFPRADVDPARIARQRSPDPDFRAAMERLAADRAAALRRGLPAKIWRAALGQMGDAAQTTP